MCDPILRAPLPFYSEAQHILFKISILSTLEQPEQTDALLSAQ